MSTTSEKERRSINLRSPDGTLFVVDEKTVALESNTIKSMIDSGSSDDDICIDGYTGRILGLVVDYFNDVVAKPKPDEISSFHARIPHLDDDSLWELLGAAVDLRVGTLSVWAFLEVGRRIKEKSVEEVQKWLKYDDSYNAQEKEEFEQELMFMLEGRLI